MYSSNNTGASQLPTKLGMYASLMDTILHYQNVLGMYTTHNYEQLYNMAVRLLGEFTFDVYSIPKVVVIPVRPNKTAPLPAGYIDYIQMQLLDDRNEVVDIVKNTRISALGARINDRPEEDMYPNQLTDTSIYQTLFGYYMNDNLPGAYGFGGEFNRYGEFNIDVSTKQILLPTNFPYQKLVIIYLSNEANKDEEGNYVVHVFAQDALMRRIDFDLKSYNTKKYSLGEIQLAEQYKNDSYGHMVSRFASFTPEEFFDAVTLQIKLAVKS